MERDDGKAVMPRCTSTLQLDPLWAKPHNHRGVEVLRLHDAGCQPTSYDGSRSPPGLTPARLDEQLTTSAKPGAGFAGYSSLDVQPFRSAIQGNPGFVDPGLRGHAADGLGGYVGRVDGQDVHTSPELIGQGGVKIPFINAAAGGKNIAAGTPHRSGVNIGSMQLDARRKPCQRQPHRP